MDTSEIYIKMCEKATEIQKQWRPDCGDHVRLLKPDGRIVLIVEHPNPQSYIAGVNWLVRIAFPESTGDNLDYKKIIKGIWLPRQDQLQEMINLWWKKYGTYGVPLIKGFYEFSMQFWQGPFMEKDGEFTFEQLWLAFTMKLKFKKVWNGNDWENLRNNLLNAS
jgi:hypothetical protein